MAEDNLSYEEDYNIGEGIIKDIGNMLNTGRDNLSYVENMR